jgi:hypothetical protein
VPNGYGKQKVVYHINAVGKENIEIRVVLHGNGLAFLTEPDPLEKLTRLKHANATEITTAKIDGLKSRVVAFNVCANTVRGHKADRETALYNVIHDDIVPGGVAEVAKLQQDGYVYIKPRH